MLDNFSLVEKYKGVSGIYKLTNLINYKVYIGQAVDLYKRYKGHVYKSKSCKYPINKAIFKYGINNFKFEILELINDANLLDESENKWITVYKSLDNYYGYNLQCRGKKDRSLKASKEFSDIMSAAMKKFHINHPEARKQYIKSAAILNSSPEIRNKATKSLREFYKNNQSPRKGCKFTEEHRNKISEALKGIKRDPDCYKRGLETRGILKRKCAGIKIQQIDIDTLSVIEEFDSIKKAADATNTPRRSISYSINTFTNRKFSDRIYPKAGNFYWNLKPTDNAS